MLKIKKTKFLKSNKELLHISTNQWWLLWTFWSISFYQFCVCVCVFAHTDILASVGVYKLLVSQSCPRPKGGWAPKNWCFRTVVLEKTLEGPLDSKEIKPVNPKGNQFCIFTGRTDAEAQASILWPPDAKSLLIGKDPDAGRDWGQKEKGATEYEMVGWHHRTKFINEHEFEQTRGDGEEQGSLACCVHGGHKESDMTEQPNDNLVLWWPRPALALGESAATAFPAHMTCVQLRGLGCRLPQFPDLWFCFPLNT